MKIADHFFSKLLRKDVSFLEFVDEIRNIINLGRYQMRIVSSVPTWTGDDGEHLLYISGGVRRLYFYDGTNSTWHFIEWNASGEFTPTTVANVSLTGQTASIAQTTIYTPGAAGLYRASVHHLCTTAGTGGTLDTDIHWTNDVGTTSTKPAPQISLTTAGNWGSGIVIIRSTATAIKYSTTVSGATGSPQYALWVTLERLL
jgi:hypothetical protein